MKNKSFRERRLEKREIFSGHAVAFRADIIRLPDGRTAVREFMSHPGAVAVLPVLADGSIVMVRQYRYPVGEATLEVPAGKLHSKKDDPLRRAEAELKEETGYSAGALRRLVSFWPTPAFSDEILHVYLATGLRAGGSKPDSDEFIRVERMALAEAFRLIKTGGIKDAKTVIALQMYALMKKGLRVLGSKGNSKTERASFSKTGRPTNTNVVDNTTNRFCSGRIYPTSVP